MTSKKENFILHKIFFNERCHKQPEGGGRAYNVDRHSVAHLHLLPHFLVIHFPHPIIMGHPSPHPHFLSCPSPPSTIPETLYLQPLQKNYTPHPSFMSQYVYNNLQNIEKKRQNQCFCAHRTLIFWKK